MTEVYMAGRPTYEWMADDEFTRICCETANYHETASRIGVSYSAARDHAMLLGIRDEVQEARRRRKRLVDTGITEPERSFVFADSVRAVIGRKKRISVEGIADELDVAPGRVRTALDELREGGYRVPEEKGEVVLQSTPASTRSVHKSLLDGDEITVGIVSDTHLASKECAYEHLELAYDDMQARGVTEVWHPGDIVAGRGIYRTQDQDLTHFTFESQVDNAVERYPKRDGMQTLLIGGNHDLEGDFGKIAADPCQAISRRRDDITYLGAYSTTIELVNGAHVQLVHGRGGGGYAVSYKPQKYVEGLPSGRKPALIVFGHWHISGYFKHRNVGLLLAGCFEWQTSLLVRLGLQPDVGYWIVKLRLGEDGSLIKVLPEWTQFYEGRAVTTAIAA